MMVPVPVYAQNIIVGVVFESTFAWYVTEKEFWYLDYIKYDQALSAAGFTNPNLGNYSSRFDIGILNEKSANEFFMQISNKQVATNILTQIMLTRIAQNKYDDLLDFAPSLLVNFDQKQLFSQYPEMIRFEKYVPDGWTGLYRNFMLEVPEEERYWIVDGKDLFKGEK